LAKSFSVGPTFKDRRCDAQSHDQDAGGQVVGHHRAQDEARLRAKAFGIVAAVQRDLVGNMRQFSLILF